MQTKDKVLHILLSIITVILVFAALKATRPVSLPVAFSMVLVIFFYPLYSRLNRIMPRGLGAGAILLIALLFLSFVIGALSYGASTLAPRLPDYVDQTRQLLSRVPGISLSSILPNQGSSDIGQQLSGVLQGLQTAAVPLSLTVLVLTLLVLMLLESDQLSPKIRRMFDGVNSHKILQAFRRASPKFVRYVLVQSLTSVLTGVLTWIWCVVMGIDFAFVWGLIAFVLNFFPTIGSIAAVVPPVLFAFAFRDVQTGVLIFIGLAVIQIVLGNFVDPKLQGRALKLSAVVVLLAVLFWGWLWGIGGAIIGVPLTVFVLLFLQEFESTHPIAVFLSDLSDLDKG